MSEMLLTEDWGLAYQNGGESKPLVEASTDNDKLYISGVFMQSEVVNRNKRLYPKKVLEKAVNKYIKEQVNTNQALGELNHPNRANVDPAHAAIRITEMWWEGNNVMGKAVIVEGDGGAGDKAAALIRSGWVPGVSSRGLGSVKQVNGINEVQEDFRLTVGVDIVWGPSAPSAYVKSFTESSNNLDQLVSKAKQSFQKEIVEEVVPVQESLRESFLVELKEKSI